MLTRRQLGYLRWIILIVLIGDGLFAAAAAITFSDQNLGALFLNLGTELVGAAITYGLFELVIGLTKESVEKEEELANLKAELITQMGSDEREVAVPAANELRRRGWLTDGSLQGPNLGEANLQEAYLQDANLLGANLWEANLQGTSLGDADLEWAFLSDANLQEAYLGRADLKEAYLRDTNLQETHLGRANLEGVDLVAANLEGAYLWEANLEGANLEGASLEEAILEGASLEKANLKGIKLDRETKITDAQLTQAASLEGAYCSLEREETRQFEIGLISDWPPFDQ